MNPKPTIAIYVVTAVLLLVATGWSLNLATYNWFAADFHNEYSQAYASRGNHFFFLTVVLSSAFVLVIIALIRRRKKDRPFKA
jgi:multisubunit Na+/H+ antiporter MnhB subunit